MLCNLGLQLSNKIKLFDFCKYFDILNYNQVKFKAAKQLKNQLILTLKQSKIIDKSYCKFIFGDKYT